SPGGWSDQLPPAVATGGGGATGRSPVGGATRRGREVWPASAGTSPTMSPPTPTTPATPTTVVRARTRLRPRSRAVALLRNRPSTRSVKHLQGQGRARRCGPLGVLHELGRQRLVVDDGIAPLVQRH